MALLDLDDFKTVNDTHGHVAGDALLCDLAGAWQAQLRGADLIARYGGDEFALIMPDTKPDDAINVLERAVVATFGPDAGVRRSHHHDRTNCQRRADLLRVRREQTTSVHGLVRGGWPATN